MGIHNRSREFMLAAFALMLVAGFVIGTTNAAVGQAPPDPVVIDRGVLVLELGSVDRLARFDAAGSEVSAQAITTQGCKVTLGSAAVLASLSPIPSTSDVGMFADGIGVKTKGAGGNGQPCGRVDGPSEGLVFALAGELSDHSISRAELDIEGKFNVEVVAELFDGPDSVGTASLPTGTSSDSGPDSADGDNYRWEIDPGVDGVADVLFDRIVFTVSPATPSGAFSLEGGADGTVAGSLGIGGSAFQLVDVFGGIIPCGADTFSVGDGINTPLATFTRGDDDDGPEKNPQPCSELIGYDLTSTATATDQNVTFEFETDQYPSWFGTFTWAPEPSAVPVPATQVDKDGDGAAEGPLQWCDGFGGVDGATGNPRPVLPSGEPWCLVSQSTDIYGPGLIQVTQTIFGETDPGFIRPK